jgi:elongation factor Tu
MASDPSFRMTIDDVFMIRGRGTVVTGRIASGTIRVGDTVELQRPDLTRKVTVSGIEMFRKVLEQATSGDNVGLLLRDIVKEEVKAGDLLVGG